MTVKIELGTLIHGTLRSEDLLQAFADELERQDTGHYGEIKESRILVECERTETEGGSEMVNVLMDALNEYAPGGYYFGAIEGDGSDFGFWTDEEED